MPAPQNCQCPTNFQTSLHGASIPRNRRLPFESRPSDNYFLLVTGERYCRSHFECWHMFCTPYQDTWIDCLPASSLVTFFVHFPTPFHISYATFLRFLNIIIADACTLNREIRMQVRCVHLATQGSVRFRNDEFPDGTLHSTPINAKWPNIENQLEPVPGTPGIDAAVRPHL